MLCCLSQKGEPLYATTARSIHHTFDAAVEQPILLCQRYSQQFELVSQLQYVIVVGLTQVRPPGKGSKNDISKFNDVGECSKWRGFTESDGFIECLYIEDLAIKVKIDSNNMT